MKVICDIGFVDEWFMRIRTEITSVGDVQEKVEIELERWMLGSSMSPFKFKYSV